MKRVSVVLCSAILSGLLFGACNKSDAKTTEPAQSAAPTADGSRQVVTVDGQGFHPAQIAAKAGQTVTLVFRRVTDATCGKQVVFKDLGIKKDLPLNQDVAIDVKAGSAPIAFACGMDMMHGSIVAQ